VKNYILLSLFFVLIACGQKRPKSTPKLIVLISVDQMRGDYLTTFSSQLEYGLKDFSTHGLWLNNTHHRHAITTTAAGHATISTGCHPSNNGIVNNTVYNRALGHSHYSIEDSAVSYVGIDSCSLNLVSAKLLNKPSFGDIVKQNNPKCKSYSVALKDRASILMGGHLADRAFWFDAASTQMVSTDYYTSYFPEWAKTYNANTVVAADINLGWVLDPKFEVLGNTSNDSFPREKGLFNPWFPHEVNTMDQSRIYSSEAGEFLWHTPFGDKYVLEFSKKLIEEAQLGQDEHCDILTVGLSAADIIGHHFGPNSYEILDYYNKLDEYLGEFMATVKKQVGEENVVFILTSDHGVADFPEVLAQQGVDAKRIERPEYESDIAAIDALLQKEFNLDKSTISNANYNGVEPALNYIQEKGIDTDVFCKSLQEKLKQLPYIEETYSMKELSDTGSTKNYIQAMRNSFDARYGYYISILPKEHYLIDMRENGTTHGTPYAYDTHVPLIFLGNDIEAKIDNKAVGTIDIAPTILGLLQIHASDMDGHDLFSK